MTRGHLLACAGVVLLANAIAVGMAAYNRSGVPTATIVLTERELELPPADPENTGIWLYFPVAGSVHRSRPDRGAVSHRTRSRRAGSRSASTARGR